MKWEDPPKRRREYNSWRKEAAELRANPGRWGLLAGTTDANKARSLAWQVSHGRLAAFRPAGAFQAVSRAGAVYVRFMADHKDHHNDWDLNCPQCQQEMTDVIGKGDEMNEPICIPGLDDAPDIFTMTEPDLLDLKKNLETAGDWAGVEEIDTELENRETGEGHA